MRDRKSYYADYYQKRKKHIDALHREYQAKHRDEILARRRMRGKVLTMRKRLERIDAKVGALIKERISILETLEAVGA